MMEFYLNLKNNLDSHINNVDLNSSTASCIVGNSSTASLKCIDFNMLSVSKAISSLNGKAAAGPDNIPQLYSKNLLLYCTTL